MTDEINPSELGAYTNNLPNKEGLKKLCDKVNNASGGTEYTAGDNIQISAENVISATDTKYTAGTNVQISEQNVISSTDTKYTAGTNVAISDQNVISATDTVYTAGTGISISDQNVISATGSGGGTWTERTANDDWTDMFTTYSNFKRALKDVLIRFNITIGSSDYYYYIYIPKNVISSNSSSFYIPDYMPTSNNNTLMRFGLRFSVGNLTDANIVLYMTTFTFVLDGTDIKITSSDTTQSKAKSTLKVWTRD